jgi:AcrR family transcriptional regulator
MPRAGLTAERIVSEAAAVADEVGLDQLTLAAVAQRFGVALPSLYKHIDGLAGLKRGLAVLGMDRLGAALTKAAVGRSGRDALTGVAHAYRSFASERPGLYAATLRAPRPDDVEHIGVSQQVLDVLFALMASYRIDGSDAVHAIRFSRSALHGFVALEGSGAFGMAESVDQSFDLLIGALHVSLTRWETLP